MRFHDIAGKIVFTILVVLLPIVAIPYGSVEVWWKAFFICAILLLTIVWLVDRLFSSVWFEDGWDVIAPMAALCLFALIQSVRAGTTSISGVSTVWNSLSADPSETRFFALQLLALTLTAAMLFSYLTTELRMRILINVVIIIAVGSAFFGIVRQATQPNVTGFGLPLLVPTMGYAQFVNKNHFAYLVELGLGLALGLLLGGGVKRQQGLIYVAALLAMWAGLGLSLSRGGLVSMMAQVMVAVLVLVFVRRRTGDTPFERSLRNLTQSLPARLVLIGLLAAAVVVGTFLLGGDRLATKIGDSTTEMAAGTSDGVSRSEIWSTTLKMFAAHPLVGVGMGAYWIAVPKFHDASGRSTPQQAHNDYLEVLASGGIVGAAILVWFAVAVIRRIAQNLRSPNRFRYASCLAALVGISGVAVHSLLDFGLHAIINAFIFTTLVVIATSKPRWANQPVDKEA